MNKLNFVKVAFDNQNIEIGISDVDNSIWMSVNEIANLFHKDKSVIRKHIKNIVNSIDASDASTSAHHASVASNGKTYNIIYYHRDLIEKIGYAIGSNSFVLLERLLDNQSDYNCEHNEEIIIYDNGDVKIPVKLSLEEETIWMKQEQIAALFNSSKQAIAYHINKILKEGELNNSTVKESLTVQLENGRNVTRNIIFYNLDMLISIGYRVNSKKGIQFRKWATKVLNQYLRKGYVIDKDKVTISTEFFTSLENDIRYIKEEINNIKQKTFIEPIKEKAFFQGQYFDAYEYICSLVAKADKELIIIDPYFDEHGLNILSKTKDKAIRRIYLSKKSELLENDIEVFKKQYGDIKVIKQNLFHDRFIIIDRKECYSIGASFNRLGEKAFSVHNLFDESIINAIIDKIEEIDN